VEPLAGILGVVSEQLASIEGGAVVLPVLFHLSHKFIGAEAIDKSEGSTGEWRESKTKHCANVSFQLQILNYNNSEI